MTNSDWYAEVEGKSASLPTLAPSSDLFDGELFSDELIDIYNTAVGEGEHPGTHENDIPVLPDHEPSAEVEEANKDGSACNTDSHPGAKVAAMAAAIDDGLGAFRPSTSFNDLSTLLPGNSHDGTAGRQPASSDNGNHQETEQQPPIIQSQPAQQPSDVPHTAKPATATTKRKDETVVAPNKALKANATATPKSAPPATVAAAKANLAANAKAAAVKVTNTSAPNPLTNVKSEPMPSKTLSTNTKAAAPADSRESAAKMGSKAAKPDTAASAPQASSKPAATEADFKSVAQAAISSLIQSTKTGEASKDNGRKIDTSTKHIKALTGNNWVAACSGAVPVVSSAASTSSADSKANAAKPKRQNMTADERARQNRDRNREHARNTRLRKKAYVEELKKTLTELVAQRDRAELEQRQASQREAEQREVRFRVIEEFLRLRGSNETSVARWSAILVDGFTLTLPATDFQEILYGEPEVGHGAAIKLEQVLSSVSEVMAEANDFATFLQALGKGEEKNNENDSVEFVYHCDRANFFMDGSNAVLDWTANSVGAIKKGASAELSMRGSIRARFCPASNKLISANIVFDSGAVLSQLHELSDIQGEAAARAASNQADAILDSLQMPHLDKPVGANSVAVVPQGDSSDEGI